MGRGKEFMLGWNSVFARQAPVPRINSLPAQGCDEEPVRIVQ